MKSLTSLIKELENKLPFIDKKNEAVSKVTVGWHLEHSLLAMIKMISAVENSNPTEFRKNYNLKRSIVLMLGKIPRGKAKVPDSVIPGSTINMSTINPLLEKAKGKVDLFEKLTKDKFFTHPVFGAVRVKKARRIIAIHTIHHTKIINDILKGS